MRKKQRYACIIKKRKKRISIVGRTLGKGSRKHGMKMEEQDC